MAECVKGSDTSAEEGGSFSRVKIFGYRKDSLGTKSNVFSVATVLGDTIMTDKKSIQTIRRETNPLIASFEQVMKSPSLHEPHS